MAIYIDILSDHRDRNKYPLQSEFVVNINKILKENFISLGYPLYNFSGEKIGRAHV